MSTTTDTERRLRDANPTPADLPKPGAAWSSTELLDQIDLQTRTATAHGTTGVVHRPAHRQRGPLMAMAAAFAVIIVVGAVALVSSTNTDAPPAATPTTQAPHTTIETPPTTQPATAPAVPRTIEIEAFDYGYSGFDTDFKVGDILELFNRSEVEFHNLVVIRLDDDDIRTVGEIAEIAPEGSKNPGSHGVVEFVGAGRTLVSIGQMDAAPGEDALNGRIRLQRSGRYIALDTVAQGADPLTVRGAVDTSAPSYLVAGGPLGYQHGMIIEFIVTE